MWCVVFLYRREGYVPSNYVKKVGQTMEGEEWFFPTLSRTRAEDILKEEVRQWGSERERER